MERKWEENSPQVTLEVSALPVIHYALAQNGIVPVRSVTLTNRGGETLENLELEITASPAFLLPLRRQVDCLPSGQTVTVTRLEPVFNGEFLASATEKTVGFLEFRLIQGDRVLASERAATSILACDQWHGIGIYPELLCAFVTPNHPQITRLVARATEFLGRWTGDTSMDAYQSQNPNRVLYQAAAIYEAIREHAIAYAVAPASFEQTGQRVRLCDEVLGQKLGTCLDLTLLYASCLEAVGLHSLLVLTQGHIFPGLWLEEQIFPECVQDDVSLLTKRMAAGVNEIAVVEATALTSGRNTEFDEARSIAQQNLRTQTLECIIDVHRARLSGVSPLPQRVREGDRWAFVHQETYQKGPAAAPRRLEEKVQVGTCVREAELPKKVQWERKLLDLGLRNTLINLRLTKTQLPLMVESLDQLENALSQGGDFGIMARPENWPGGELSFETIGQMGSAEVLRADFAGKRLRSPYTEAELNATIKNLYRSARTSLEENGANTLYLALGMLRWYENRRSEKARYAPVILLPIEMVRRSAAQGYVFRLRDEEPQMNITLLEKLKQDFGITVSGLDPLPMDEHGVDIRGVLTVMRQAVMAEPRWDVLEAATMGIFSFSQFVMWNDIRNRAEDLMRSKVVRSLMEGKLCWDAQPLEMDNKVEEDHVLLPMAADASQLYAIKAACAGESFVLHGPPGTGKSQTITSLIANALAQGKRVLFVAEKMAALEVVQKRLDSIGIGPFCLELHSNKSRKRDVLDQLRQAAEVAKTGHPEDFARKADRMAAMRKELDSYAAQLHQVLPCGSSLYGLIREYEAVKNAPELKEFPPEDIRGLTKEKMEARQLLLERLVAAGREVGHPQGHPLSPVGRTEYTQDLRTRVPEAVQAYENQLNLMEPWVRQLCRELGEAVPGDFWDMQRLSGIAGNLACWYDMPQSWAKTQAPQVYFEQVTGLAGHRLRETELRQALLARFDPAFLEEDGEALFRQFQEVSGKWFLPKALGMNKLVKQLRLYGGAVDKETLKEPITQLRDLQREKQQGDALFATLGQDLEQLYRGPDTDWRRVEDLAKQAAASARELWDLYGSCAKAGDPAIRDAVMGIWEGFDGFSQARNRLDALLCPDKARTEDWFASQKTLCADIIQNMDALREWITLKGLEAEAREECLGTVTDFYMGGGAHGDVLPAWKKAMYRGLICDAIDGSQELSRFSGPVFNKKIQQFQALDQEWTQLSRQEIFCRLASQVPNFTREAAHSSELGILQRAIKSGGRGVSIRKLFDQIPNLLPRLCPCMLMSPISAAQYLDPKAPPFDIVVFDEASQLPTCKAVGVLARGENAVVVGDPKQMPPTTFFAVNTVDEENLEAEDLESILDDCLALNMPQSHLLWHYRSRHESLIAFSNTHFYENKLFTFPSVNDRASRVRLVPVEGVFERGKNRVNRQEAQAVVEELKRRWADPELSGESVGVVTINIAQQNLIDDLLSEACTKEPELEKWAYGSEEPIFIKNLENVQGDERDVILFSVGYGPDENGKVYMNFGPLNRDGGWRRLNVAVTRARKEMTVFSTLRPDQIDLNRTKAEGVAALRDFLEYAQGRPMALGEAEAKQNRKELDSVARSLCDALRELGYDTDLSVGRSQYRMDVAVVDPRQPERYLLGIQLDGAVYRGARTTRDREIAQQGVLKGLGWKLTRLWTVDWWDNPQKELRRLEKLLKDLQKDPEPEQTPTQEPPKVLQSLAPAPGSPVAPVYLPVALPPIAVTAEAFVEPGFRKEIKNRVRKVLKAEAPVSAALLTRRVVQSCGISRAGSRIQNHIQGLLSEMELISTVQPEGTFFWREDQNPDAYPLFRVSGDGEAHRDVREVPVQETANAVCAVLYEQMSMLHEDLLRETARKLGYTRLGTNVIDAMDCGLRYAKAMDLVEPGANGMLCLTREGTERAQNRE